MEMMNRDSDFNFDPYDHFDHFDRDEGFNYLQDTQEFDPQQAEDNRMRWEISEAVRSGEDTEKILSEYPRPVDSLAKGRQAGEGEDPLLVASRARFNLDTTRFGDDFSKHYRKILLVATANTREDFVKGFNNPDMADEETYKKFVLRFPTADKFQNFSDSFLGIIGRYNSPEKTEEYGGDMKQFKEMMFGKQQKAWDIIRDSDGLGRLEEVTPSEAVTPVINEENTEEDHSKYSSGWEADEPKVGADLGNGYKNASVYGYATRTEAYRDRNGNEDVVFYEPTGLWYLAVKG